MIKQIQSFFEIDDRLCAIAEQAEQRCQPIFDAIDHANTESMALLRESYKLLREKLGRIPTLVEFDSNNAVDPVKIFKASGSYHAFKKKVDPKYTVSFDDRAERLLSVLSRKLGRGTRLSEAIVLEDLLNGRSSLREHLKAALTGKNGHFVKLRADVLL